MMTAAANTSNEFAPQSAASDANDAFAAAPERGRLIISGKSSDGIPSAPPIGDRKAEIASAAPLARNAAIAEHRRTIAGTSPTAHLNPSFAPLINEAKQSLPGKRNADDDRRNTIGMMNEDTYSAMAFYSSRGRQCPAEKQRKKECHSRGYPDGRDHGKR